MRIRYSAIFAALLAASAAAVTVPVFAQTPISDLDRSRGVTIEGRITDVFGNKFVQEDDSGRILVETGAEWYTRIDVRPGARLKVAGRPDGGGFNAFRITREDGREIVMRSPEGPPPWAKGPKRDRRL